MQKSVSVHMILGITCIVGGIGILCMVQHVHAAAWWGEGYRKPEWIVQNGGTIINYRITGTSHPEDYKAMMFRNGEYVEVEFGKNATFDDAKNGTYVINFYKCKDSCLGHKVDKKTKLRDADKMVASITIVALPGQTNQLVFNAESKVVTIEGRSGGYVARKPVPVQLDPFAVAQEEAKKSEGQVYIYMATVQKKDVLYSLSLLSRDINHDHFGQKNVQVGILPQFVHEDVIAQVQ